MRVKTVVLLTVVSLFCVLAPLAAQEARGTLLGRVSDPSNAVVPAKIDALNSDTGVHFASTTNSGGDCLILRTRESQSRSLPGPLESVGMGR